VVGKNVVQNLLERSGSDVSLELGKPPHQSGVVKQFGGGGDIFIAYNIVNILH